MNVYVIAATADGPSKVGIAKDPKKRLRNLQVGSAQQLALFYAHFVGHSAAAVERAVHRALSDRRCSAGNEWFDVTPDEARTAIQLSAGICENMSNETATLRDMNMKAVFRWFDEQRRIRDELEERGDYDTDYEAAAGPAPPSPLELIASSVPCPLFSEFQFCDYLLSWNEGMWLRWALAQEGRRLPRSRSLTPYLEADRLLEQRDCKSGRHVTSRWIEWSAARPLTAEEAAILATVWDKFAPAHNLIEEKGPHWATHGIDDHVDDVHLYVLSGDPDQGDVDRVVFHHGDFRAVLIPERKVRLFSINWISVATLHPLEGVPVRGFVAPVMPSDIWERPFLPWMRTAKARTESALSSFLLQSNRRYPVQREYDGPQPRTIIHLGLDCIDKHGFY